MQFMAGGLHFIFYFSLRIVMLFPRRILNSIQAVFAVPKAFMFWSSNNENAGKK